VNARTWISIANLVAIVSAFVVLFEFPQYYEYAFYGLLAWILVGFVLFYAFRPTRAAPQPGAPSSSSGTTGGRSATPLASGTSPPLDFCIFCGSTLPVGAAVCPACGHRVSPS
jgi:hypothetical protein